jgi:hypothetical protein
MRSASALRISGLFESPYAMSRPGILSPLHPVDLKTLKADKQKQRSRELVAVKIQCKCGIQLPRQQVQIRVETSFAQLTLSYAKLLDKDLDSRIMLTFAYLS